MREKAIESIVYVTHGLEELHGASPRYNASERVATMPATTANSSIRLPTPAPDTATLARRFAEHRVLQWRMPPDQNPAPPRGHQHRPVQLQRRDGRTAYGGAAQEARTVAAPPEMRVPRLQTRVIERDRLARLGVCGVHLGALLLITRPAGAPQGLAHGQAASGAGEEVFG